VLPHDRGAAIRGRRCRAGGRAARADRERRDALLDRQQISEHGPAFFGDVDDLVGTFYQVPV
jgi:hypothetical protein